MKGNNSSLTRFENLNYKSGVQLKVTLHRNTGDLNDVCWNTKQIKK